MALWFLRCTQRQSWGRYHTDQWRINTINSTDHR